MTRDVGTTEAYKMCSQVAGHVARVRCVCCEWAHRGNTETLQRYTQGFLPMTHNLEKGYKWDRANSGQLSR